MSTFSTELAAMARSMQDFFEAMSSRREMAVGDAVHMLETLHGENAPIAAMRMACRSVPEQLPEDTRFWMKVYTALLTPTDAHGSACTLH